MKQKDFEIFIPISKSIKSEGEHGRFIRGWASVPKEDRDGDLILPTDLSINPFMKQGYINYEHKKGGIYKLGVPTDKTYIDLQRGLFIEAKLFDDSPYADKMWDLAEKVNSGELDVDDDNMLGFSIEAHYSHRDYDDPRILRNVVVTNVALTTHPSNTSASWSTFVKSFTTGSDIVGEGDTGGAAFRKQSFARDLRQLSYTIKSFSSEDWDDICNMLDEEGRYDHNVAKTLGLMYEVNKSEDNDDEDSSETFKSYMSNMFGEPVNEERNTEVQEEEINKSNENSEENSVVNSESESDEVESSTESNVESEISSETSSETASEATSESEISSETVTSESEPENSNSESESTSESESSVNDSESNDNSESVIVDDSTSEISSETATSESEATSESVTESNSELSSESVDESELSSEQDTPETSESTSEDISEYSLDSDVSKLTSKIDKLEDIIKGLKEDLDKQKLDIPDITDEDEVNDNDKPARREPVETDGSEVANRQPINQEDQSEENYDDSVSDDTQDDSKEKVEGFLEKIENNLPEIRYRLLPSEFIEFNNALRHLRSGSATAEDGHILQETLKTVGVRSQVQ